MDGCQLGFLHTSTEASVTTILDSDALESSTYCKSKFKLENPGLQAAKTRVFGFGKTRVGKPTLKRLFSQKRIVNTTTGSVYTISGCDVIKIWKQHNMADSEERSNLVSRFVNVSGVSEERARFYLESASWNLEVSLSWFFWLVVVGAVSTDYTDHGTMTVRITT